MSKDAYFVDANIPMYAVGAEHPLKAPCVHLLEAVAKREMRAVIDVEVLQEILHRYTSLGRREEAVSGPAPAAPRYPRTIEAHYQAALKDLMQDLAGTGTLNRGVTVNGANHVLILNLEWSPELVDQKWAAQRAVQDREAQHKSVEAILAEAVPVNAQLAVAKAVLTDLRLPPEASDEEQAAAMQKAQEAVDEIAARWAFGRVSVRKKARRRKPQVSVVYFRNLFDGDERHDNGGGKGQEVRPPAEEPVQLAMFAM